MQVDRAQEGRVGGCIELDHQAVGAGQRTLGFRRQGIKRALPDVDGAEQVGHAAVPADTVEAALVPGTHRGRAVGLGRVHGILLRRQRPGLRGNAVRRRQHAGQERQAPGPCRDGLRCRA